LRKILLDTDFTEFQDDSFGFFRDTYRLFSKFGWYRGDYIEDWFGKALSKIIGNSEITFKEAFDITGKTLMITTCDITLGEILYMSHTTTPDLKIKCAVRRSTSLPFIYKPDSDKFLTDITVNDVTRKEELKHLYIDGGMLDNYPIQYFDEILGDPKKTLGLKQMTSLELCDMINPFIDTANPKPPKNLADFFMRFFILLINKNFKIHIQQTDWERTIPIDTKTMSSINFSLSKSDKDFLLQQGKIATEKFLDTYKS